jgi:beta-glucosidase
VVTAFGYALGVHAPGLELMLGALPTAHHQLLGHGLATAALRAAGVRQVMLANNYSPAWAASESPADQAATAAYAILHNWLFTDPVLTGRYPDLSAFGLASDAADPASGLACVQDGDLAVIAAPLDGLGMNYYLPTRLSALPDSPLPFQMQPIPGYPVTSFGWPVVPAGLTEILGQLGARYGSALPPLYITENGCAHDDQLDGGGRVDDRFRIDFIDSHLRAVHAAISDGLDVRGYFHWTLADNFEWGEGFTQRFGLVHVDHASQARTPKSSYSWYRDVIAAQRGQG